MTTYAQNLYGKPTLYGRQRPVTVVPGGGTLATINSAYLIDPFTALPIDYTTAQLTWTAPDPTTATPMNEFRLLSSRYGFPVDENDGTILFDTTEQPGSSYADQNVVPGEITYYGFYILGDNSQWIRAGFTAVLMPVNHGYLNKLWGYLPEYMRDISDAELTATDNSGSPYLAQFLQVVAWPLDYIKTQYDFLYQNQNSPMGMSFSDLGQLAGEIGMPFYSEVPAYYIRKAAANWALVMQQRGSLPGIAEHISLLSGYGADVQISQNILLEDDQSLPLNPVFAPWSAGIPYQQGEVVSWPDYPQWVVSQAYVVDNYVYYNDVAYQCIAAVQGVPPTGGSDSGTYWAVAAGPFLYECAETVTALPGTPPPGALPPGDLPESNASWTLYRDQDAMEGYLDITGLAGGVNTWEVLWGSNLAEAVPADSLTQGIGCWNPSNYGNDLTQGSLRCYNKGTAAQDIWCRSVSRLTTDVVAGSTSPDPQAVVEHGVPVPKAGPEWVPVTRYATGSTVTWNGRNYLALRASTGATPPSSGSTPEWAPLGTDARIPLMTSAQAIQNITQTSASQYEVYPFAEFYDSWGNLITRVFARDLTGYVYDSFTTSPGASLAGRETDAGDQVWTVLAGTWKTDSSGDAYPAASGAAFAGVTAPVSCTQAVTFTEPAPAGYLSGLLFWYQSATACWAATTAGLYYNSGGTWTQAAAYTSALQTGDRIYVVTNQATPEITVYRNTVGTYSATTGNGQVAQVSGAAIPAAVHPASTATVSSGLALIQS